MKKTRTLFDKAMNINHYNYFFNHAISGDDHSCLGHLRSPELLLAQNDLPHQHSNPCQRRLALNDKALATGTLLHSFNSPRMIAAYHKKGHVFKYYGKRC
jgi:hypothetical protein